MNNERVGTGIDMLDEIVHGGFRQGKSYLISGESGTGKTSFGLQFMQKGFELGEAGVFKSRIRGDEIADIEDDQNPQRSVEEDFADRRTQRAQREGVMTLVN